MQLPTRRVGTNIAETCAATSIVWFTLAVGAFTQATAPAQQPQPAEADQRTTGLPPALDWTFNFDAGWGTFGFGNSLYANPKENVVENLSDQWFEGYVKPALSGSFTFRDAGSKGPGLQGSQLYGKVSAVGERTYGSQPPVFGQDVSSFQVDDLAIGWRSGKAFGGKEHVLDFTVGRTQYTLGHGMLLYDGAAEGGSRGGYWTNARKAFEFAVVGRVSPNAHTAEVFYLDKDELPEADSGSRLWGINYEFSPGEQTTFGATYMKWFADPDMLPGRDGLNVFNVRAYTHPLMNVPDLSFEFEYAREANGDAVASNAWTLLGAYELSQITWTPKLSYRYASFEGDDPETPQNESFDPLFPGFSDWGSWWQGEIAGEYFLSNSNLISHQYRAHVSPTDAIGAGIIVYQFKADHPATYAPQVTARDLVFEVDAYTDWELNSKFTISFVGAFANPGRAVEQATGRTKNFTYGMVYVAYRF